MINLLKRIFTEYDFERGVFENTDDTFAKIKNNESYIVSEFTKEEFFKFFESEKINLIIKKFEIWQQKCPEIKKNTSLIILLKGEKKDFFEYRNQIFKIEEDEFFFRKFVINYSSDSYSELSKEVNLMDKLTQLITDDVRFKAFEKDLFSDPEYNLIMQLFVKLPFVVLHRETEALEDLDNKIKENLNLRNLLEVKNHIETFFQQQLEEPSDHIDKFAEAFLSESESNELVGSFFKAFGGSTK